ncbi:MAG: GNAT family N-acetyltransferase [Bacteroidales bacterium]|nr:GNAT family N-acetyltransferase [Bacteroidales bacterium]
MTNNILHGQQVFLRALEPEDLEMLYKWENDTDIWNVSETLSPISRFILKRYLENAHKDIFATRQLRLVVQLTGTDKAVGTIDLFDFDQFHKRAGVGILIAEKDERRKGYAEEALQILVRYCREILKIHQLYCTISSGNQSSTDLFMKVGFNITGTRKEWIWNGTGYLDEHFLQMIL